MYEPLKVFTYIGLTVFGAGVACWRCGSLYLYFTAVTAAPVPAVADPSRRS